MLEIGDFKDVFKKDELQVPGLKDSSQNEPVDPEKLLAFRARLAEARSNVLECLKAAATLEDFIRFTNAYGYVGSSSHEWVLRAGEDYAEFANASAQDWFEWARDSMSDHKITIEAQRVARMKESQGEVLNPALARITIQRYPLEDLGYEYRVFATLPAGSDFRYNLPLRHDSQAQSKQVFLQPSTGCTMAAIHYVFADVPPTTESVTVEVADLELEQLMEKIGYNPLEGGTIHYTHRPDNELYKWNYVLFGAKGGFSNEQSLLVSDL